MDDPSQHEERLPFRFRMKEVPSEKTTESWGQIESRLGTGTTAAKRITAYALGMLGAIAIIAVGWWLREATRGDMTEIRTAYGETRQVVLPDSSLVFMNANSVLRRAKTWDAGTNRNVWLEGEAYFEVRKRSAHANDRFIVHAGQTNVQTPGARFNINILRNKTTVSLKEGMVQLTAKAPAASGRRALVMTPGDEVQVEEKGFRLKAYANVAQIADWRNHRYHFDNTSFTEIVELINSRYGYEVHVKDQSLLTRNISGELYAADIDQFIKALSVTMNVSIEKNDHTLTVR
jgi:transmembrane sensor